MKKKLKEQRFLSNFYTFTNSQWLALRIFFIFHLSEIQKYWFKLECIQNTGAFQSIVYQKCASFCCLPTSYSAFFSTHMWDSIS
jgi:hypothetical protein